MKIDFDRLLVKIKREISLRDFIFGSIATGLAAFASLVPQLIRKPEELSLLQVFYIVISVGIIHLAIGFLRNTKAPPRRGFFSRDSRKVRTGAIVAAVNRSLGKRSCDEQLLMDQITSLLQTMKLHVQDYLGDHSLGNENCTVFASLLLLDGKKLVVCARDEDLRGKRRIGDEYDRENLFVNMALSHSEAVSVGHIRDFRKNDQSWRQKPYRDILGIPVVLSTGKKIGVVSIDSTTPYYFHDMEQNLYTGLQPYIELLALSLERLCENGDADGPLKKLIQKARNKAAKRKKQAKVNNERKNGIDPAAEVAVNMNQGADGTSAGDSKNGAVGQIEKA